MLVNANPILWMEWTIIHFANLRAAITECSAHPLRDLQEFSLTIVTAADACLIRNHDNQVTKICCGPTKFKNPFDKLELIPLVNVAAIDIDYSIPVEKERAACQ